MTRKEKVLLLARDLFTMAENEQDPFLFDSYSECAHKLLEAGNHIKELNND